MSDNLNNLKERAGKYVAQRGGFRIFFPNPLPPKPALNMDDQMIHLLSMADRALGRLDASTEYLPNPDLFVYMYVMREAVSSSQIEGTQATFHDAIQAQADIPSKKPSDVDEIINYVSAMNYGLDRIQNGGFPLSLRLIREIHEKLLQSVRGKNRTPGEFRKNQNWIGSDGCTKETATYIPPPPNEMLTALGQLELFINDDLIVPPLIKAALIHAQFETIHPFLDGNGRIGRLLITLFLCDKKILRQPLLYLSVFFKNNRSEYYNLLQNIHENGDFESWVKFFLRATQSVAKKGADTARNIISLREEHRKTIQNKLGSRSHKALVLLDSLYKSPWMTLNTVMKTLGVTYVTAVSLLEKLVETGIIDETEKKGRTRSFCYSKYLEILSTDNAG